MSTVFNAVVDALKARLTSAAVCASIEVDDSRTVQKDALEAVRIDWDTAQPAEVMLSGAPVDWKMRVYVDCFAQSRSQRGKKAVDDLIGKIYAAIASDRTLAGACNYIGPPNIDIESDAMGERTGWARLTFAVELTSNMESINA